MVTSAIPCPSRDPAAPPAATRAPPPTGRNRDKASRTAVTVRIRKPPPPGRVPPPRWSPEVTETPARSLMPSASRPPPPEDHPTVRQHLTWENDFAGHPGGDLRVFPQLSRMIRELLTLM